MEQPTRWAPRPRDATSDAFNTFRREITHLIEVESRKVFAASTALAGAA